MQLNKTFLDRQRRIGDQAADSVIIAAFSEDKQSVLYELLRLEGKDIGNLPNSAIKEFILFKRPNPIWFDPDRIGKGQQLFKQYALEMMGLLGLMSLPYCYAASPGNKALYLSDKMRGLPGKRLLDTASFVIDVLTPGSLDDDSKRPAHIHINKVRLIHALSRYYIKQKSQWDMKWGEPINQEDMAGTNLAFSYLILRGMQLSGYALSQNEKENFIFVWRYIGHLLHINNELLPSSLLEAEQLTSTIQKRNFKKTEEGVTLTSELLSYYKQNVGSWQSELITSQVKFYLGKEVAGYVGLSPNPIRDRIASSINDFRSVRNFWTVRPSSYQKMLLQQLQLKKFLSPASNSSPVSS